MRVLVVSTYELGQQPLAAAGLAAALATGGHQLEVADLAVEEWPGEKIARAEAVVFSVPMYTATELALAAAARIEAERPRPPLAFVGLYAPLLRGEPLLARNDLLAAGEAGPALLGWLASSGKDEGDGPRVVIDIGPATPCSAGRPARELLPPLEAYSRYLDATGSHTAAAVEATRGCNHSCRHCPVAPVYRGRSRPVPLDDVLADLEAAVSAGARHISFADPDFLNRPRHALQVAEELHRRHGSLSFDATIKVEHLLRHRALLPRLAECGLSFVVSAFESTDDRVLAILEKGHIFADLAESVRLLRQSGIEPRPSWLPFTPWTTPESLASLLEFTARADLVANTDPVQYSIRLLLPPTSLLLERPDPVLEESLAGLERDGRAHSVRWRHRDKAIDALASAIAARAEKDAAAGLSPGETFAVLWSMAREAAVPLPESPPEPDRALASPLAPEARPRLSEAWFCCAEPTAGQRLLVGSRAT